jgi:hypothetical protein
MFETNKLKQIKTLFDETERARKAESTESIKKDPEWPLWYAQRMKFKLEKILDRHFTVGELVYLLISAESSHKKTSPDSARIDYYAKYLLEKHHLQKEPSSV